MRLFCFYLILLSIFPALLSASDIYQIENLNFIPPQYYVGDEVELKIRLTIPEKTSTTGMMEKRETRWIEIVKVSIVPIRVAETRKIIDLSIIFISFRPGKQTLPLMNIGDIELNPIEIDTLSVLDKRRETGYNAGNLQGEGAPENRNSKPGLAPPRSQLLLPDTWMKLGLLLLIILFLPLFIFLLVRYLVKGLFLQTGSFHLIPPRVLFMQSLRKLRKKIRTLDPKSFFIILSDKFRKYLGARLSIPALTSTTREISLLSHQNVLEKELCDEILRILTLADFVKFGGRPSEEGEMTEIIRKVVFIVKNIEEEKRSVEF